MAKLQDIPDDKREIFITRMKKDKKTEQCDQREYVFTTLEKMDSLLCQMKENIDALKRLFLSERPDKFFISNSASELLRKIKHFADIANKFSMNCFTEIQDITYLNAEKLEFTQTGEHLHIVFPSLLPMRISDNHSVYSKRDIISMYEPAFRDYFKNKERTVYKKKAVIIYTHYFSDEMNLIDHDNFETKIITDIISSYILLDDSPKHCSLFMDYKIGEHNHTEIDVIPFDGFEEFLQEKDYEM